MRRRSNHTWYLGEREIRQRVSLDQASRAGKPEPYNRRKPSLDSTGNPELQTNAVDGRVLKPDEINGTHINGRLPAGSVQQIGDLDGNLPDGKLPNVPKPKLPGDIHYGKINRADIHHAADLRRRSGGRGGRDRLELRACHEPRRLYPGADAGHGRGFHSTQRLLDRPYLGGLYRLYGPDKGFVLSRLLRPAAAGRSAAVQGCYARYGGDGPGWHLRRIRRLLPEEVSVDTMNPGRAIGREIATGDRADSQIDSFTSRRQDQRVKSKPEREAEAA